MAVLGSSGGGTSGVTEITVNANGTVAAGDPVLASGGTATKISGKAASFTKTQPGGMYHDNYSSGNYYHYHVKLLADTAQSRGAMVSIWDQISGGNFYISGFVLNANGSGYGGTPVQIGTLGQQGQIYDMIYDHVNTCWLVYATEGSGSTDDGNFYRWGTSNGTSGSAYKSQDYDSSETQHYQSFVKDASGRIYSTTRHGATNTFRIARVQYTSAAHGEDVLSGTVIGTNTHNGTVYGVKSVYDATNDQIIVLTGMNSTSQTYKVTALDIDGSGGLSISHTATFGTSDGVDSNTTGNWNYHGIVDMKMDTSGNIAMVNGYGGFIGMHNSGSAITFGEARSEFFGTATPDQCGIFPLNSVSGMFVGTRVATHSGGANAVTGTFFQMANGKISGDTTTKTIGTYENSGAMNITYGHSIRDYFFPKFALAGTSDVLWTPYNAGNGRYSYASYEDFAVSNLDLGALAGIAKTGASNGNSMVVNLSGATQTGLSGKVAGTKYFVNNIGAIVDVEPTTTPKAFLGTGLSSSEILIGESIEVETPTSIEKFTDVPTSLTYSGSTLNSNDSSLAFTTGMSYHMTSETASASGTSSILTATGAGICQFFIISPNTTSNQTTQLEVYCDDTLVISTGNISSRTVRPVSLVGEYRSNVNSASYYGTYLNHGNLKFNNKFEVRRVGGVATSFIMMYKILGV
tara:strand:+ start:750 stop:2816 length:2067 start_codon:yes stop_codon:yes gene_type:complete